MRWRCPSSTLPLCAVSATTASMLAGPLAARRHCDDFGRAAFVARPWCSWTARAAGAPGGARKVLTDKAMHTWGVGKADWAHMPPHMLAGVHAHVHTWKRTWQHTCCQVFMLAFCRTCHVLAHMLAGVLLAHKKGRRPQRTLFTYCVARRCPAVATCPRVEKVACPRCWCFCKQAAFEAHARGHF